MCFWDDFNGLLATDLQIKFKDTQNGHVSGITFEDIDIIQPHQYAIGIDQNGQSIQDDATLTRFPGGQRHASNVTINDVLFQRVRATLGKRTKSHPKLHEIPYGGLFTCNPGGLACRRINFVDVTLSGIGTECVFENTFGVGSQVHPASCVPPA